MIFKVGGRAQVLLAVEAVQCDCRNLHLSIVSYVTTGLTFKKTCAKLKLHSCVIFDTICGDTWQA